MDELNPKKLYKALMARDPRYDGRIYFGVLTTGIYCRPICSAKPLLKNIKFFRSKAEAEKEGLRPCLRCRPDLSPLSPQWQGTAAVVNRALNLLESHEAHEKDLAQLSLKLGLSERHIRRLFQEHVGASPIEVLNSKRLHLARQLLTQTPLSILDVAMASGFNSSRRFNEAFLKAYKKSPRDFRKANLGVKKQSELLNVEFDLITPFDWKHLLNFFARHEIFGSEVVTENSYSRHFKTSRGLNYFKLVFVEDEKKIKLTLRLAHLSELRGVIESVRSQFDLAHNPHHLKDKKSRPLRIPGAFSGFEVAVSIILGQLVTTEQAKANTKKLVLRYGEVVSENHEQGLTHLFPAPEVLAQADLSDLGITRFRAEAIRELARLVAAGEIDLSKNCDLESTRKKLLSIKGVGPWTVEMIAMRCLSDCDAFPKKDLIIERALEKFKIKAEDHAPWRAYLALTIWKAQAHILTHKKIKR